VNDKELKELIIENMEGIIVEPDASGDKDILDFYADVFVLVAKKYAKQQNQDLINQRKGNAKTISDQWKQIEELKDKLKNI